MYQFSQVFQLVHHHRGVGSCNVAYFSIATEVLKMNGAIGVLLRQPERMVSEPQFKCSIWGPTCDGLDCIVKEWPAAGAAHLERALRLPGEEQPAMRGEDEQGEDAHQHGVGVEDARNAGRARRNRRSPS